MALVYDQMPAGSLRVYRATDGSMHAEGVSLAEGVMDYGGGRLQLITRDAVISAGDLDARAVITLGHPAAEVTPDNYRQFTAGDAGSKTFVRANKGGFAECHIDMALRAADAIGHAERGELTGLSRGHMPLIVNEAGVHPTFGPYTEKRIGHVGDTNHIALCGNTAALPPPRGPGCGIYLDSQPVQRTKGAPMKRPGSAPEWRHFFSQDAVKARLHAIQPGLKPHAKDSAGKDIAKDALNLEELAAEVQSAMADPESLAAILVHAIVNKPAEVEEIKMGAEEPMDQAPMMAAMDAKIKAATDAVEAKLSARLAELDALKGKEAARDAATRTANESQFRTDARALGIKTAATDGIADLVAKAADRLDLAIDGLTADAALLTVSKTAARRAANPGSLASLSLDAQDASDDFKIGPATAPAKRS
jgi:hypothetical protein